MIRENEFLLHAFCLGIFVTFIYDTIRVLRRIIPHNNFCVSLEDFVFWIYCTGKVFLLLYHESNGQLRWFAVLGAFVGMFIYKKTLGILYVKYVSLWIQSLLRFVLRPLQKLFCRIGKRLDKAKNNAVKRRRDARWKLKKKLTYLKKLLKMTL